MELLTANASALASELWQKGRQTRDREVRERERQLSERHQRSVSRGLST